MNFEKYIEQQKRLPKTGQQIIGQFDNESIIVYQAFNPAIVDYAVKNQKFGGNHYSFNRMTWIKPNFMWMMYRAGWAQKINQERIVAIRITKNGFEEILSNAVHSSYKDHIYENRESWKVKLATLEVRLQWDPDHDPLGNKLERKAIQLGFKGDLVKRFNEEWILEIEDITPFVLKQKDNAIGDFSQLTVPSEDVYELKDKDLSTKIDLQICT